MSFKQLLDKLEEIGLCKQITWIFDYVAACQIKNNVSI